MADSTKHANYDQIAPVYDNRYRVNRLVGVERALLGFARSIAATQALEVGCRTGRWQPDFSNRIQARYAHGYPE